MPVPAEFCSQPDIRTQQHHVSPCWRSLYHDGLRHSLLPRGSVHVSRLWSFLNRHTQDLCSLTHTKPFLGIFLRLHVLSLLSRQGLNGISAEKKSAATLVQHTKVSSVSPHGYSQNPGYSIASSFVLTWQKHRGQILGCSLWRSVGAPYSSVLPAGYWEPVSFMKPAAQLCAICLPSLPLYSGPAGPNPGIFAPVH